MVGSLPADRVAGVLMIVGAVPTALIIRAVWPERHKLGVVWFLGAMGVGVTWELAGGLNMLIDHAAVSVLLYSLTEVVLAVGAICWLLLAIEYTTDTNLSLRAFAVFAFVPALFGVGLLIRPTAFYGIEPSSGVWAISIDPEIPYLFLVGYDYLLAAFGSGLWIGEWFATEGSRRRRAELFLLATVILFGAGVVFIFGSLGVIETPIVVVVGPIELILASGLIAYSLTAYQLFRLEPVAREMVVQEMDDGVVILDDQGQVVDANPAAQRYLRIELLGPETASPSAADIFADNPELAARVEDGAEFRTETTLTVDGVERDFDLNVTAIAYGRTSRGTVVVLRDITTLKQRQRDLALLKRLLTRVFRHNIRNDMTAIRGYAETIELQTEGELADSAREILAQSDELIEQSEKTRLIAEVIDADDAVSTTDLVPVIRDTITSYRTGYPAATITSSLPDAVAVRAHRNVGLAIEQLIENAVVHSDDPEVAVSVDTDGERIGVVVEDSGPGIPPSEIEALHQGEESKLEHGSGVGLWLATWIVEYSGGDFVLERTDSGTRAVLWLQRADHG